MRTENRTGNSISSRLRRLMMILVPLSALYIGISVASTYYFKKQIVSYAETFVDFYIDKIENTVTNINRRMSMLILGEGETEIELDSYINSIKTTDNIAFRNYFIGNCGMLFACIPWSMEASISFLPFFRRENSMSVPMRMINWDRMSGSSTGMISHTGWRERC